MSASVARDWLAYLLHWWRGEPVTTYVPGHVDYRDATDRVQYVDVSSRVEYADATDSVETKVVA